MDPETWNDVAWLQSEVRRVAHEQALAHDKLRERLSRARQARGSLTPEKRQEIARAAARARWSK